MASSITSKELVALEERLGVFSIEARAAVVESGLSRHEITQRMGDISRSKLDQILDDMAYNAPLDLIARFALACGYELKVSLVKKEATNAKN